MRNRLCSSMLAVLIVLSWTMGATSSPVDRVEQWGLFEIELKGPENGNPFVDVRLSAVFDNGTTKVDVPGFYDGDGTYRIRFSPETPGLWRYETRANRWELTGKAGTFDVTPPGKGNHGPVRIHNTYHFAYADGTAYKQIGTTIYNWLDTPRDVQEATPKTLASSGVAGSYYLTYFGREKPMSWVFRLYKRDLTDGMRFAVDVIDTWNMTVTPVDGEFVTKKKDNYHFVDARGRTVPLPGTPGIAVRVRYVGGGSRE